MSVRTSAKRVSARVPRGPRLDPFESMMMAQRRLQSHSTMAATAGPFAPQYGASPPSLKSTLNYSPSKDFSTRVATNDEYLELQGHWNALLSASQLVPSYAQEAVPHARAYDMDLMEAAERLPEFDKMLLLVNHGEGEIKKNDKTGIPVLSGRGMGQALSLSRRTAMFCTPDSGLSPELVVLSPLGTCIQTALHAFPYQSPVYTNDIPWICHSDLVEEDQENSAFLTTLQTRFPGIEFVTDDGASGVSPSSIVESKQKLLGRSDRFLERIHNREEKIIVVSSHSTWLQSFCGFTLDYTPSGAGSKVFAKGEMRAVGLRF